MPRHQHRRHRLVTVATAALLLAICVLCWSTTTTNELQIVVGALAMTAPGGGSIGGSVSGSQQQQQQRRTVLVTGGAGYIGSHTCLELLKIPNKLYRVIVVDNLDNSSEESLRRVRELVTDYEGSSCDANRLEFRNCDIRDKEKLNQVLTEFPEIDSCIHFAGLKAVGESSSKPLDYYDCNIGGTINLLHCLETHHVQHFVFSSSATVYGEPEMLPLIESARLSTTNPYGRTKLFVEEILRDTYASSPKSWNILILRYFNPIGAHASGRIGEDPQGIPNNLMPFIAQVCVGRRPELSIFGNDYDTPDGTGVRDYIHVVDLAKGHVAAIDKLYTTHDLGCEAINLGTGHGVSVLELVNGMVKATGLKIKYKFVDRRPGDVASMYADPSYANTLLNWKATLNVQDMCNDTWKWQSTNPYGYNEVVKEEDDAVKEDEVKEEEDVKVAIKVEVIETK